MPLPYGRPAVAPSTDGRQPITVRFEVRNNGPLVATDTPQVYLTLPSHARPAVGADVVSSHPPSAPPSHTDGSGYADIYLHGPCTGT